LTSGDGIPMTPDDHQALLDYIEDTKRRLGEVLEWQANPTTGDGWHDESFGRVSREAQRLFAEIRDLELLRDSATIVVPEEQNYEVRIGTGVVLKHPDGSRAQYLVCGYVHGERGMECVSVRAPLGQALLGKHYGEEIVYEVEGQKKTLELYDILSPKEVRLRIEGSI